MRTLVVLVLAGAAIGQTPSNPANENLKQVMRSVLYPNSTVIFGTQLKPSASDLEWRAVEKAALAIQEAASLILMPGRLRSSGQPVPVQAADYIQFAQALAPAGGKCLKAAQKKSLGALSNCTDLLSDACDNCHKVYRDKP
jgi:cytochrome c556